MVYHFRSSGIFRSVFPESLASPLQGHPVVGLHLSHGSFIA
jgi:hypothetical protein